MIVTGATRGIGRATVDAILARGGKVVAIARNEEALRALEASAPVGVGRERLGEHLQRDPATEFGVLGDPDLAHTALAQQFDYLVMIEGSADHSGRSLAEIPQGVPFPPVSSINAVSFSKRSASLL